MFWNLFGNFAHFLMHLLLLLFNRDGCHMLTVYGTPDFTPFVSFKTMLQINDSGLFAWISLAALSRTYII